MATKLIYPAVFHPEADGGYSVDFPDLLGFLVTYDSTAVFINIHNNRPVSKCMISDIE